MTVSHRSSSSFSFSSLPETFTLANDGSLSDMSAWQQQAVPLPAMRKEGDALKIKAVFNPEHGGYALDNIKVATRDTCVPK